MKFAAFAVLFCATNAFAQQVVNLSDYLAAPAGQSNCDSNPPFMESLACTSYGFGHDCPGNWTSTLIQFVDTEPFAHGIGMHPPRTGAKSLRFDLDAIRDTFGREPMSFETRLGIEFVTSNIQNGARFITTLDDVIANDTSIGGRLSPSIPLSTPVTGIRFLQLSTEAQGDFNSNHACFANARIVLGPPCPAPVLGEQPRSAAACLGSNVVLHTIGTYWGTFSYQWRKNGQPIAISANDSAQSATLNLFNVTDTTNGDYDCVVSNACGSTLTQVAHVRVCAADFNCDSVVDLFDYLDFLSAFSTSDARGDYNADGVIDFFDYLDFVQAFSTGC